MPASYEDLLDQFFTNYSHHFTPSGQPHKVDPKAYLEAEKMRRAVSAPTQGDAAREFVNKARAERGLPPIGDASNSGGVPVGDSGMSKDQMAVLNALRAIAAPQEDVGNDNGRPSALDYGLAIPGTAVAAYNNNMPKITGSDRSTVDGLITGSPGSFFDEAGDSFNRVLNHAIPPSTDVYSPRRMANEGIEALSLLGAQTPSGVPGAPSMRMVTQSPDVRYPVRGLASIERDMADNAALQRSMRDKRQGDPREAVDIRTPEQRPIAPPPPNAFPAQAAAADQEIASAPQSSATSAGNAGATSNPPPPSSSVPPPPDAHPGLRLLARILMQRGYQPDEIMSLYHEYRKTGKLPDMKIPPQQISAPPTIPEPPVVSYGKRHKDISQPMVADAYGEGQPAPSAALLNNAFDRAGIGRVNEPKLQGRLDFADDVAGSFKAAGHPDGEIADMMKNRMASPKAFGFKANQLPAVVGPTIGAAAALNKSEPDHHSEYQPRDGNGRFKGPPAKDWYSDNGDE